MWEGRELLGTIFLKWRRKPRSGWLLGVIFLFALSLSLYYDSKVLQTDSLLLLLLLFFLGLLGYVFLTCIFYIING